MSREIKPPLSQAAPTTALTPPSLDQIDALARQAIETIPAALAAHVTGVVIRVEDFVDTATMRAMGLRSPLDLLGLYHGTPIPGKSVSYAQSHIDMIFLYRRPILEHWLRTGEALDAIVRHVLIHEIGHHFGFSDDDMARIERAD
ncbi:MAG TPA: metallopeptidase family protein [Stellaceae bacterium]